MKKMLATVLSLGMVFALASCGTKTQTEQNASDTKLVCDKDGCGEKGCSKDSCSDDACTKDACDKDCCSKDDAEAATMNLSVSSADELKEKKLQVSVMRGTVGDFEAQDLVGSDHVEQYEKYTDVITALKQGKVAASVMDEGPAKKIVEKNPDLYILPEPLTSENYAIGIKKGNDALTEDVNAVLKELKESGKLQEIIEKYTNSDVFDADVDFNKGAKGGTLVIGLEAGFYPYEMKAGDAFVGIDIEIGAALAKAMDKELVVENMNFDALPTALASGKIDLILSGFSKTPERAENMNFSDPYIEDAHQVIVVKNNG